MVFGENYLFSFILCVIVNGSSGKMLVSLHQETPRLEDFFWTGSGDGPPPPPDPVSTPVEPSSPVVRTTTVLATVYLDSYPPQAVTDKTTGECILNCGEPTAPGSLEAEVPEDRRYWLLTVIQGSTPDSLQLRLARLYQKAFLRQQERHLGIIKSLDSPTARKKHEVHSFVVNKDENLNQIVPYSSNTDVPLKYFEIEGSMSIQNELQRSSMIVMENATEAASLSISATKASKFYPANIELISSEINSTNVAEIKATRLNDIETERWVLVTPTVDLTKREVTDEDMIEESSGKLIDIPLEEEGSNETLLFKREIITPEQQPPVQVHIQNITESPETGSVQIVYVVMVGGRAVPAAVAARDMRLVRDAEVAQELGATVTTKAEPAYLKAAEGLEGAALSVSGTELWALAVGGTVALLVLVVIVVLLCLAHRRKTLKSARSLRAYRDELMREIERNQLKQVHEEKDGRLISVVSPSRTRPSSTMLPIYRTASASGSSTSSSEVAEASTSARRRQKKPHVLRMPQKKRVGTTDSLLEAAGVDSSDSQSAPHTPTSFLSMPSVNSFPRGNTVEPLSRILEPISVRHLDIDSPVTSPRKQARGHKNQRPEEGTGQDVVPRRQMASQLVRLGSIEKDPGVIGPLVWDLHCQRIKESASKPTSPKSTISQREPSRMRARFNELMDDAFSLFGSAVSSPDATHAAVKKEAVATVTQARNDNVRLPGSPFTALDTVRGKSAAARRGTTPADIARPRTSAARPPVERKPTAAWATTPPQSLTVSRVPTINPAYILPQARLPPEDPALPLISAIKSEIQKVRENAMKNNN